MVIFCCDRNGAEEEGGRVFWVQSSPSSDLMPLLPFPLLFSIGRPTPQLLEDSKNKMAAKFCPRPKNDLITGFPYFPNKKKRPLSFRNG